MDENTFSEEEPRTKVKKYRTEFLANSIYTAIGLVQKDCQVCLKKKKKNSSQVQIFILNKRVNNGYQFEVMSI